MCLALRVLFVAICCVGCGASDGAPGLEDTESPKATLPDCDSPWVPVTEGTSPEFTASVCFSDSGTFSELKDGYDFTSLTNAAFSVSESGLTVSDVLLLYGGSLEPFPWHIEVEDGEPFRIRIQLDEAVAYPEPSTQPHLPFVISYYGAYTLEISIPKFAQGTVVLQNDLSHHYGFVESPEVISWSSP
jgi:hypothetical protein